MDYDLWTQCAPRAPFWKDRCYVGRLWSLLENFACFLSRPPRTRSLICSPLRYGTFDHLLLLLGRMTNFASRDLVRKRRAKKPDPNAPRGPGGPGQSPPMFPGLVPSSGNVTIPTGFSPPREPSPPLSDVAEDQDIEASTAAALQEWGGYSPRVRSVPRQPRARFRASRSRPGHRRGDTFGPSRMYRTYSIAGIWMNYFMGLIALYRAHPSMPPIAMVAAGITAGADYALGVGDRAHSCRPSGGSGERHSCGHICRSLAHREFVVPLR